MTPQRLGKFEIRREIGKGSMGVVYEGYDPLIRRRVAIKVIRNDELLDRTLLPELMSRLQREAQAAGRLNHPGIVAVYDYGEDTTIHGSPAAYIAMEFVDGSDLKTLLDSGKPLTVPEIARWMGGILAALQHAHDRGVTHRDIKPSNVMMLPDGTIKIADFGIARLDDSELTRTGSMIGTPQYMAPEQLLGLEVDGRADLFSCGVVLYQLLTGVRPFSGSYATVVQKVLNEQPPPPTSINRMLAPGWDAVVRHAMAKAAAERYQSAAEFALAIGQAASVTVDEDATVIKPLTVDPAQTVTSAPVVGNTVGARPPAATPAAQPPTIAAPRATARTPPVPLPLVLAGAVGVGGLVLLAALWWPRTPGEPTVVAAPSPQVTSPAPVVPAPPPEPPAAASAPAALPPAAPVIAAAPPVATPASTPKGVRPSPAPPAAAPRVESKPAVPAAPPFAAEWQVRRDAVQARSRLSLPAALAVLLDLRSEDDRQKVVALDAWVNQRGPNMAASLGVVNGHLAWAWRSGSSVAQAREAAMGRCAEVRASACAIVMVDGELRKTALLDVASGLGTLGVAEVRSGFMRSLNAALERGPAQQAAAAKPPVPAPPLVAEKPPAAAAPEPTRPAAAAPAPVPTPAKEWADAVAALRSGAGRGSLAGALGVLFAAQRSDESEAFAKFERAMQRLPWKSALAMSQRDGGWVRYGWSSREQRSDWASDAALQACKRDAGANCVVVMVDGKLNEAAFLRFAEQFGQRPQAAVRDALVRALAKQF